MIEEALDLTPATIKTITLTTEEFALDILKSQNINLKHLFYNPIHLIKRKEL
jgi:hypothetical protein